MRRKSETELRQLARDCVTNRGDDRWERVWKIFRTEAYARYVAEDDGPRSRYGAKCVKIFEAERFALSTNPNTYMPGKREAAELRELWDIPADEPLPVITNATRDVMVTFKTFENIITTKHGFRIPVDDLEWNEVH